MDSWATCRRVLCIRLDSIGDVLMTTPAFHALRDAAPDRRLTLLTSSAGAKLAPLLPDVDDVIVYDAPWIKATADRTHPQTDLDLIERLRSEQFDASVVFNVYTQNPVPAVMLAYLAGIPLRAAYAREKVYGLLTDWLADPDAEPGALVRHEVRRQLDLVHSLGADAADTGLRVNVPISERARVTDMLGELAPGLTDGPWALLHPGATAESRRYPVDLYAEAASTLVRQHGWSVVVAGGPDDREAVEGVAAAMTAPHVRAPDSGSVAQLAALIAAAPVLIANNSAPAHLAAAVGTPVVSLYALTNPQHTPWRVPSRVLNHDVPCRNCLRSVCPMGHHLCLRGVSPQQIVDAALDLAGPVHMTRAPRIPVVPATPVSA